jgi:DNA-binding MarR family transcriptional regulator
MNDMDIATTLNSAVTRLSRRIRRIDDRQDIGRARLSALSVLVFGGPRTISELAAEEMVSVATMHHVVKGLESLRLAGRKASKVDRRATIIHATGKGRRFMERARQARLDFYNEKLEQLSEADREAVARFAHLALGWLD